ncbi:MAG TPA: dihydrodipicolinate reductase C-terminal domain-containing protein [Pyrinomonadaceae bacterium]|nr:4-hydroxy-tetrahydrodipicolinate reductase [Acidobacteriota bacterium]HQZ97536.1 dihydrodipicolinate reductase C-terminal domain-containing protein [Pyrinomonadaceae bacterium]
MKIALIGYGEMGRLIRRLAEEKGHEVFVVIDDRFAQASAKSLAAKLVSAEVAIDFTVAGAVKRNVSACVAAGVALVEGTTGWNQDREAIEKIVRDGNGAFLFGANFSIGVNLFYRIAAFAAELFAKFPDYETFIEEQHHSRKLDAPSGTALKLKEIVAEHIKKDLTIAATRAGNIPGTHRVGFDGPSDQILLEHTARSREGFASGAITAAEWIVGKKGFFEFTDVIDEM